MRGQGGNDASRWVRPWGDPPRARRKTWCPIGKTGNCHRSF